MTAARRMTRKNAFRTLEENRKQLRRLGVEKIALYGSVARDEAAPQSDVDVLVELADAFLTLEGYMDLCFYLEELIGRRVDVTTFRSIKPHMRDRVLAEAVYPDMRERVPAGSNT